MPKEAPRDRSIWIHLWRCWTTFIGIEVLCTALATLVAGPALAFGIEMALAKSSHTALSDTDIITFLLTPMGLLLGFLVGSIWLTIHVFGYATLLVAGHRSYQNESPTITGSLARISSHMPNLLGLAARYLTRILAFGAPFIAGVLVVAWVQLRQKDINYYLTVRPPEFILAVVLSAILLVAMALILIRHTVNWFHAVPLALFNGENPKIAHQLSVQACKGQRRRIFGALALWAFGTPLILAPLNLLWPKVTLWTATHLEHRLGLLALALAILFAVSLGIAFLVSSTTLSLLSLYNLKLFRQTGLADDSSATDTRSHGAPRNWKFLIVCGGVLLLVAGFITHQRLDRLGEPDNAVVIAHRGASAKAPENTMAAIESAIMGDADWIEIDVQETTEGEVVVFHDRDFMRMSRNPLGLRESTAEQRAKIDIGTWFDPKFSEERTPTLRDALELCKGQAGVIIELKYYGAEEQLEKRVVEIVEETGMTDEVMLMSLKPGAVRKIRKLRPEWRVGLLSSVSVGDLTKLDVDFLGLNASSVSDRMVDRAHRAGIQIYAWTVNDPAAMSSILSKGVDGIITDKPRTCRKVLSERAKLNPGEQILIDLAARLGKLAMPEAETTQ